MTDIISEVDGVPILEYISSKLERIKELEITVENREWQIEYHEMIFKDKCEKYENQISELIFLIKKLRTRMRGIINDLSNM